MDDFKIFEVGSLLVTRKSGFTMAKKTTEKQPTPSKRINSKEIARKVPRSAKTGLFVTEGFADKHPSTTVVETVKVKVTKTKKRP